MPIYEYTCEDCKKTFSVLKLSSTQTETACSICGSKNVKKLMSSFCCSAPDGGGSTGSGSFGGSFAGGGGG